MWIWINTVNLNATFYHTAYVGHTGITEYIYALQLHLYHAVQYAIHIPIHYGVFSIQIYSYLTCWIYASCCSAMTQYTLVFGSALQCVCTAASCHYAICRGGDIFCQLTEKRWAYIHRQTIHIMDGIWKAHKEPIKVCASILNNL